MVSLLPILALHLIGTTSMPDLAVELTLLALASPPPPRVFKTTGATVAASEAPLVELTNSLPRLCLPAIRP